MKKYCYLFLLLFLLFANNGYSDDTYLLVYKPNKLLKYKASIYPIPPEYTFLAEYLFKKISDTSILKISYAENENNNLNVKYIFHVFEKRSCCNPLSYPGFVYKINSEIENIIEPSGKFISCNKSEIKAGCIFGFNLKTWKLEEEKENKPVFIIPCYFPNDKVRIQSKWFNKYEIKDKEITDVVRIDYSIFDIDNNIASINGSIEDKILIKGDFDIINGYWVNYKIYYIKNSKEYIFKSFELIKQ